ncbi:MAG: S-layer family protein [Nostocaceae cyanobacterium]|nr:S-layer family protein [Nostocaceae cyanobacterium]
MSGLIYFVHTVFQKGIFCNNKNQRVQGKTKASWILGFILFVFPSAVRAQIVPDATLPTNSIVTPIVTPNGTRSEITGGTIAGTNLFHSFERFSIPTGQEAFFDNSSNIENIINRVTGGSISNIDGLIKANGSANVFLINPNGIVFGPNASLNINGSFVASTAESIKFPDGSEFSATNPQGSPLLIVNVPMGLQFGSNPSSIQVQGTGNNLSINRQNLEIVRNTRPFGLQVPTGQTLALVGGNLDLQGGNLTAESGRIELGSVGADSLVSITPNTPGFQFSYKGVNNFQDISLSEAASVDTSGNRGGNVQVRGQNITLTDGSAILTNTLGNDTGGTLEVKAASLTASGTSDTFFSGLFADVASTATGRGGNINVEVERLSLADGGQIRVNNFGAGSAGELQVQANEVELRGDSKFDTTGLFANVNRGATGSGGILTVETDSLRLTEGAQMSISTLSAGNSGTMTVKATDIELIGGSNRGPSGLFADVRRGATGEGGQLLIETQSLQLVDGAAIRVSTFGAGNGGRLTVRATEVNAIGEVPQGASGLFAFSSAGTGNGGNILVETQRLQLRDGGQIAVATTGSGNAGDLTVRASESVELVGRSRRISGLFTNAIFGTGAGGDINVTTDKLIVRDEATITASNFSSVNPSIPAGRGAAGNINIEADFVLVDNQGVITADAAVGDKGNININSSNMQMRRSSRISTNAQDLATGGNININTDTLVAFDNSDITANAEQSFAGRVVINAKAIYGTEFRQQLTPESDITASSEAGAEFNGFVELNTPEVDPSKGLVELEESPVDGSRQIATSCKIKDNTFVLRGRDRLPENPTGTIRARTVWQDLRTLSREDSKTFQQATVKQISTNDNLENDNLEIIESQGWIINSDGEVELVAQVPSPNPHTSWNSTPNCAAQHER